MSYQNDLDEHIEKNLEEDVYEHGIARDTDNPKAIKSGIDILEECFGLLKPEFLDEYLEKKDE